MILSETMNTETWAAEHTLDEMQECEIILSDLFGGVNEAMIDPVMVEFLSEAGLAADWDSQSEEISALVVQCEDDLYNAWLATRAQTEAEPEETSQMPPTTPQPVSTPIAF